jgi:hypothetical protein
MLTSRNWNSVITIKKMVYLLEYMFQPFTDQALGRYVEFTISPLIVNLLLEGLSARPGNRGTGAEIRAGIDVALPRRSPDFDSPARPRGAPSRNQLLEE